MRILVWSQRGLHTAPFRCVGFEFEDVIAQIEPGAEIIAPRPSLGPASISANRVAARIRRDTGVHAPSLLAYRRPPVDGQFDLFFANFQFLSDVDSLHAIPGWRTRARRSVCVIEEVWARDIPKWRGLRGLLRGFDHVFLECSGSVDALQERAGIPCSFLPPGVDALRFCPYPGSAQRVVDVCHVGRREAATHLPLLDACKRGDLFYEFDSVRPEHVWDPAEHREHLANTLKRSRYVLVNPGKFNRSVEETSGQQELGFRFFEGAAAGAVMLGTPPRIPAFAENFGWADAVIEIDAARVLDTIEELDRDPDRLDAIRRANVTNSLAKHDWVYRWERVLAAAGLPVSNGAEARETRRSRIVPPPSRNERDRVHSNRIGEVGLSW